VARLRHKDIKAISTSLLDLYSIGPLSDLPEKVFRSLAHCVASDIYCYNEFDKKGAPKLVVHQPEFRTSIEDFNRYVHQHPSLNGIVTRKRQSPVKISDFSALQLWQRSDLYNNFFRLEGQNFQLAFLALTDYPRLGIALNRSGRDFSEEERMILALLQPHLAQAYRNSRLFSLIFNASDATNYGFIITDRSFKMLFHAKRRPVAPDVFRSPKRTPAAFGGRLAQAIPPKHLLRRWLCRRRQCGAENPPWLKSAHKSDRCRHSVRPNTNWSLPKSVKSPRPIRSKD
jgi:hypothetical protein